MQYLNEGLEKKVLIFFMKISFNYTGSRIETRSRLGKLKSMDINHILLKIMVVMIKNLLRKSSKNL